MAITPYLLYEDAGAAIAWLEKAFGFEPVGPPLTDASGRVRHADLALGAHALMLGAPAGDYKSPLRLGQSTQLLYIDTDDVAASYRRAVDAGAKVVEEPTDTPYGARRFGVEDPEGHRFYFAQMLRPANPNAGARKSSRAKKALKTGPRARNRAKRSGVKKAGGKTRRGR
jgi:uncharacterized glyoxalase superfamily protein PhnB